MCAESCPENIFKRAEKYTSSQSVMAIAFLAKESGCAFSQIWIRSETSKRPSPLHYFDGIQQKWIIWEDGLWERILEQLIESMQKIAGTCGKLWRARAWSRPVTSKRDQDGVRLYVCFNPIKAGYCSLQDSLLLLNGILQI